MGGYSQNFWVAEFRFRVGNPRSELSGSTGFFRNALASANHSKLGLRDKNTRWSAMTLSEVLLRGTCTPSQILCEAPPMGGSFNVFLGYFFARAKK